MEELPQCPVLMGAHGGSRWWRAGCWPGLLREEAGGTPASNPTRDLAWGKFRTKSEARPAPACRGSSSRSRLTFCGSRGRAGTGRQTSAPARDVCARKVLEASECLRKGFRVTHTFTPVSEMEAEHRGPTAGLSADAPAASPSGPRPSSHSLEALGGPEQPRGHAPGRAGARVPAHAAPALRPGFLAAQIRCARRVSDLGLSPSRAQGAASSRLPRPDRRRWTRGARSVRVSSSPRRGQGSPGRHGGVDADADWTPRPRNAARPRPRRACSPARPRPRPGSAKIWGASASKAHFLVCKRRKRRWQGRGGRGLTPSAPTPPLGACAGEGGTPCGLCRNHAFLTPKWATRRRGL